MCVERRRAVDRIHHRDHAIEPVAQQQIGMRHGRVQHRGRIGQAGGFQQHAPERAAPVVEIAQQSLESVDQVAAHGAAQASRLQQHHVVADIFDEEMVERHLAELVDDDGGIRQRGIFQQPVEQGGLAGAEKAGEHGQRNGRRRGLSITAWRGLAHCVAELTFGLGCLAATGLAVLAGWPPLRRHLSWP